MPLPFLYTLPENPRRLESFFFWNSQDHLEIQNAIQTKLKIGLVQRVLDPVDMRSFNVWLGLHQQTHNDQNSALGTAGTDLSSVDFENESQMTNWIYLHAQEHRSMRSVLGI